MAKRAPKPRKKPEPSPTRVLAWRMAADINWVAMYRAAMLGLLSLVIGMVGWQSNRIINRQDDSAKEIVAIRLETSIDRTNMMNLTTDVGSLAADIIKGDARLGRTNERQTEMMSAISVLQSQMSDLRARAK